MHIERAGPFVDWTLSLQALFKHKLSVQPKIFCASMQVVRNAVLSSNQNISRSLQSDAKANAMIEELRYRYALGTRVNELCAKGFLRACTKIYIPLKDEHCLLIHDFVLKNLNIALLEEHKNTPFLCKWIVKVILVIIPREVLEQLIDGYQRVPLNVHQRLMRKRQNINRDLYLLWHDGKIEKRSIRALIVDLIYFKNICEPYPKNISVPILNLIMRYRTLILQQGSYSEACKKIITASLIIFANTNCALSSNLNEEPIHKVPSYQFWPLT